MKLRKLERYLLDHGCRRSAVTLLAVIFVAGHIRVRQEDRDDFVSRSAAAVATARATGGCLDFAVSADPLDPERVNVFERWRDRESLLAFRGDGPGEDLSELILEASVAEYEVA